MSFLLLLLRICVHASNFCKTVPHDNVSWKASILKETSLTPQMCHIKIVFYNGSTIKDEKHQNVIFLIMSWIILVPFKGEDYKIKFLFGVYAFQEIHRYVLEAAPFVNRFLCKLCTQLNMSKSFPPPPIFVATPKNYKNTIVNNLFCHTCIHHQRCVLNVVVVRWKIYFWKTIVW